MPVLRCQECGLVNFATAVVCKRCGHALRHLSPQPDPESDPSAGVWQDNGLLVMRVDTYLPERCIKCNSSVQVNHKIVSAIAYSHWKLPLFVLGYQMLPHKLMVTLIPQVRIDVALCKNHSSNWERDLKITLPLILIGLGLLVLSFYLFSFLVLFLGILLFATAVLSSLIGGDPVYLKRRHSNFVWLIGAGDGYLAGLPHLPDNYSSEG
jgi:hypothetical protein